MFAHFMMGDLQEHLPTLCWVFSSFWLKTAWPPYPTLPIHVILPQVTFFLLPWMKNVLKGKCFANVEEGKQENTRSTKRHQNQWVLKLFWAVEKMSQWVNCIKWRVLRRRLKFKHVRICNFLQINSSFGGRSPLICALQIQVLMHFIVTRFY